MIRIGIELNGIIRDINSQIAKYYVKDIDPKYDEGKINKNKTFIIDDLPFGSRGEKNEFLYTDYAYEIYGCGKTMELHTASKLNEWLIKMSDEDEDYDISLFSLDEKNLAIPSTLFFLSKIAVRTRKIIFPTSDDIWNDFDVIITTNKAIVKKRPSDKVVILINKDDNSDVKDKADYNFDGLIEFLTKSNEISFTKENKSFIEIIKKYWKKLRYGKV